MLQNLNDYATREKEFYQKTGRLKYSPARVSVPGLAGPAFFAAPKPLWRRAGARFLFGP